MDDTVKNMWDVTFGVLQSLAVAAAGLWAYFRFRREGVHNPAIEFDVEMEVFKADELRFLAQLSAIATNKGQVEHKFRRITLVVRGLRQNEEPRLLVGNEPQLDFPEVLLRFENIVPKGDAYNFVRPGVTQRFTAPALIPSHHRFVLFFAQFEYEGTGDKHDAQRVFDLHKRVTAG